MKSNRRNSLAILLALLMTASALAGCSGTDEELDDEPKELEDWSVFLVQSSSDLPTCDSTIDGRLYYVSSESGFHACSNGAWQSIDLTGPSGPQGPAGTDGAEGPAGADGADGADGDDGTSFTIIGTVDETSDLGEIYIGESGDAFLVNSTVHIHVWSGSEWIDLGNISGPQGPDGTSGVEGPVGADGPSGADGLYALFDSTALSIGSANCPMGGNSVRIGLDDNGDGNLDPLEVDQTLYVCNGVNGVDGNDGSDGANGADGNDGSDGADGSLSVVMEMTVTVSSMDFYIDSIQQADVTLYRGFTYTFDQSASSNSAHPFRLSTTSDGTHGGGTQYTDGVTYTGTQGSNGLMTFTVPLDAPDTLYYYCQNHGSMGGEITIQSLGSVS